MEVATERLRRGNAWATMAKIARPAAMILGLVLAAPAASAQGPTSLEFSFSNPGARSMGFGGAFIGLADDATAAFTNPAGLVQLVRPEVSAEARSWSYETPFTVGGRALGPPTGLGIDTTAGLQVATSSDDLRGIAFFSFVYPVGRWSIAVYRHQLAKFEASATTNGLFAGPSLSETVRLEDVRISTRLDYVALGLSVACQVSDRFSVGLGLSYTDGDLDLTQLQFLWDEDTPEGFFGPNSFRPERLIGINEIITHSRDWSVLAGFLWQPNQRLGLGGVVRQGPEFAGDLIATAGPAFDPDVPPGSVLRDTTPLKSPDVYGLGLAVRSRSEALTLTFDWVRVEYSDLLDSLSRQVFDDLPVVGDADELHAGLEYVFLTTTPLVALRVGAWLDPDHRFRAAPGEDEPFDRALFRGASDEVHFAAGVGLAFRTFQLDFAVDVSDLVDTASISMIYPF